jgi:hypothetical protein
MRRIYGNLSRAALVQRARGNQNLSRVARKRQPIFQGAVRLA